MKKAEDAKWAVFEPIMKEKIIWQWLQMMVKSNVPYSTFLKDGHLMEAAALLLESQLQQPIDRKSLHEIFPDRRQMAQRIPEMKKKIDSKLRLFHLYRISSFFIYTVF